MAAASARRGRCSGTSSWRPLPSSTSISNIAESAMKFSRRRFLEIAAAAGGGLAVKSWSAPAPPRTGDQLLLLVHFSGGWDQLLALDPRPNNDPRFSSAQA